MTNLKILKQNKVIKITQNDLIDELADDFEGVYDKETIKNIVLDLQENILNHLKEATTEQTVSIRPLMGLVITSRMTDEKEVTLNGKTYTKIYRLNAKAKITRYFNKVTLN